MQKLSIGGFKWERNKSKFNEDFKKNYIEVSDTGYLVKVNVQCPKKLHELHNDLPIFTRINENWKG